MPETLSELLVSNDAIDDAPELQHRLDQDGYLFFRKHAHPPRTSAFSARPEYLIDKSLFVISHPRNARMLIFEFCEF